MKRGAAFYAGIICCVAPVWAADDASSGTSSGSANTSKASSASKVDSLPSKEYDFRSSNKTLDFKLDIPMEDPNTELQQRQRSARSLTKEEREKVSREKNWLEETIRDQQKMKENKGDAIATEKMISQTDDSNDKEKLPVRLAGAKEGDEKSKSPENKKNDLESKNTPSSESKSDKIYQPAVKGLSTLTVSPISDEALKASTPKSTLNLDLTAIPGTSTDREIKLDMGAFRPNIDNITPNIGQPDGNFKNSFSAPTPPAMNVNMRPLNTPTTTSQTYMTLQPKPISQPESRPLPSAGTWTKPGFNKSGVADPNEYLNR